MRGFERRQLALLEEQNRLLRDIRDLLAGAATPEPATPEPPVCDHPEDQRIVLSAMGEVHWRCRACKFEYRQRIGAPAPGTL